MRLLLSVEGLFARRTVMLCVIYSLGHLMLELRSPPLWELEAEAGMSNKRAGSINLIGPQAMCHGLGACPSRVAAERLGVEAGQARPGAARR